MKVKKVLFILFSLTFCINTHAQALSINQQIALLVQNKNLKIGVAVSDTGQAKSVFMHENDKFPMQSVFKLPVAWYILSLVDQGKLSLSQKIRLSQKDLVPNTWSPIRERFPQGTTLSIAELIRYTVAESDNIACDILLRLAGGPRKVNQYLHSLGIQHVSIKKTEAQMHHFRRASFKNWITPQASNKMLQIFYFNQAQILQAESHRFIWKIAAETSTGADKIKAGLPADTWFAHKTGSSGVNKKGLTSAENDIGIIRLPDGTPLFISVLLTNSTESPTTNKHIIAQIAEIIWQNHQIFN